MGKITSPNGVNEVTIRRGRSSPAWTAIPEWVLLAGFTPQALALYVALSAHVNQRRGDRAAWPTQDTLAAILGFTRGDKIKRYVDELAAGQAVDVDHGGWPRRTTYTVHELPPDEWDKPDCLADWYVTRRPPCTPMPSPGKTPAGRRKRAGGNSSPPQGVSSPPPQGGTVPYKEPHEVNHHPQPPGEPADTNTDQPQNGGGGRSPQRQPKPSPNPAGPHTAEAANIIAAVLSKVPANNHPGPAPRARAITATAAALTAGWTANDLTAHLTPDLTQARSVAAVLTWRLNNLPDLHSQPGSHPPRPPWCGTCHEPTRLTRSDTPRRCPQCHPLTTPAPNQGAPR